MLFGAIPPKAGLPDHKLAFAQERESTKGMEDSTFPPTTPFFLINPHIPVEWLSAKKAKEMPCPTPDSQ
jgi:hypothetical protein